MKKLIAFVILYSLFVILLCPSTNAQWEGAEMQQLTDNDLPNKIVGLYIDDSDELHLFYAEGVRDTATGFVYDYTLLYTTKEKGGDWSEPQEIETPEYIIGQSRKSLVGYDTRTHKTHILYYGRALYDTLYYTNNDIPDWEFLKIDSLSEEKNQEYNGLSMAFDTLGNVHLAWNVDYCSLSVHWYRGMYANNSTGEWVKQQVSPPVYIGYGESGPSGCLAVQKNGTAHLMYNCFEPRAFYASNDSLNDTNWVVDTLPKPSVPFYAYYGYEILADQDDSVYLFTGGGEDWEYKTGYFDFYYHKQGADSTWTGPDPTYQPEPDDLAFWGAFIDPQRSLHVSLIWMGFMIPTHNYFYTNNMQGSWEEPYQILYTEPHLPTEFRFVIDSEGQGHGVFIGLEPGASWDSSGIYYLGATTGVEDEGDQNKSFSFHLFQNYPNPFNTSTVINYELKEDCHVELNIYNLLGRKLRTLENGERSKGPRSIIWDGKDNSGKEVASGIYFYVLRAGERRKEQKMLLMK